MFGEVFSVSSSGSLDQTVPNLPSPSQLSPSSNIAQAQMCEHFSRKVFVGGLPPDIDEGTFIVSRTVYLIFIITQEIVVVFNMLPYFNCCCSN